MKERLSRHKMAHTALALFVIGLVVLYVVLCPRLNYGMYRPLLFHPVAFVDADDAAAPQLEGVNGAEVSFKDTAGHTIYGWYFDNPKAKYTALLSHGNGGNVGYRTDTVSVLLHAGTSVLIYDYRGYGKSGGIPTVDGICDDALCAYDYLNKQRCIPADHIILYGESLGCAVSTYVSTQRQCSGMILQSGFASLNRIAAEIFPLLAIYPGTLLADPPLDSISVLKNPHPPVFIVHGHKDQVVPFAHAAALYQAACEPKEFMELPSCGHNDICGSALPEFSRAISQFLKTVSSYTAIKHHPVSPVAHTRETSDIN
jgi:fermentation-respiration switch protein FrsA (DUF1100 family)